MKNQANIRNRSLDRSAFIKWNEISEDTDEKSSPTASEPSTWHPDMASSTQQKQIPVAWRLKMKLKGANTSPNSLHFPRQWFGIYEHRCQHDHNWFCKRLQIKENGRSD